MKTDLEHAAVVVAADVVAAAAAAEMGKLPPDAEIVKTAETGNGSRLQNKVVVDVAVEAVGAAVGEAAGAAVGEAFEWSSAKRGCSSWSLRGPSSWDSESL